MSVTDTGSAVNFLSTDSKQIWDLRMENGEITATANKKLRGFKPGVLKYTNGKWVPQNSDARYFLSSDPQNGANLITNANNLYNSLSEENQKGFDFTPTDINQAKGAVDGALEMGATAAGGGGTNKWNDINWDNMQGNYPTDHTVFRGHYPLNQTNDEDYDYFKITCYEHQHSFIPGQNEGFVIPDIDDRRKVSKGRVRLPMQPGISESNQVSWAEEKLNPLQIAGANIGMNLMGLDFDGAMDALKEAGNQAGQDLNTQLIKSYFAGKAVGANLLGRATGQTINNNLEVLFNGPKLRTFNYQYRFTPRESEEAVMVKNIIRFFKKQMAPKRSTSRIFLKSPNVFKLKYTFKDGGSHPFLNNIKMCALSGFTVNYTPDGSYSTYSDDGRGDGSMTSYDVGLSFQEITPIYNDDYWTDQEGREGTGF
tara:strand:+ start:29 stop:1303 length:1275 start_codon:yes stop_codon:yes gene_type:complete